MSDMVNVSFEDVAARLDEKLTEAEAERDAARAEVERLRAGFEGQRQLACNLASENDRLRACLVEVRSWRRAGVGLEPVPASDPGTLGKRIDDALARTP